MHDSLLRRRRNSQDVGNILGALYMAMLFLGIISSRSVQPPTSYERMVRAVTVCPGIYAGPRARVWGWVRVGVRVGSGYHH